jgi:hypothetical protein
MLSKFVEMASDEINNTSLVLIFEVGDQKLLFSGDAQIENWEYVFEEAEINDEINTLLHNTTVYKVGHHGSRNATPKLSLWAKFINKSESPHEIEEGCLKTILSTKIGVHKGDHPVPSEELVDELLNYSEIICTTRMEKIYKNIPIDLT